MICNAKCHGSKSQIYQSFISPARLFLDVFSYDSVFFATPSLAMVFITELIDIFESWGMKVQRYWVYRDLFHSTQNIKVCHRCTTSVRPHQYSLPRVAHWAVSQPCISTTVNRRPAMAFGSGIISLNSVINSKSHNNKHVTPLPTAAVDRVSQVKRCDILSEVDKLDVPLECHSVKIAC